MRLRFVGALVVTIGSFFVCNATSSLVGAFALFLSLVGLWVYLLSKVAAGTLRELGIVREERGEKVRETLEEYRDLYYDKE